MYNSKLHSFSLFADMLWIAAGVKRLLVSSHPSVRSDSFENTIAYQPEQ
jgi:hypothetical protein